MTKTGSVTVRLEDLLAFINAMSALVPECLLHIEKGRMRAIAVDSARVAIGIANIQTIGETQGDTIIGLDTSAMKKYLSPIAKMVEVDAEARISWSESFDPKCPYLTVGASGNFPYLFRCSTLDKNTIRKEPSPKIPLSSMAKVISQDFSNAVVMCSHHSDTGRITIKNGICSMAAMGDIDQCKYGLSLITEGEAKALYSLEYLRDFSKVFPESVELIISLDTDRPLSIKGWPTERVYVEYFLAPKISTDNDDPGWL